MFGLGQKGTFESIQFLIGGDFWNRNSFFDQKQGYVESKIELFRQLQKKYNKTIQHFSIGLIHQKYSWT